jgi:hypothetical protein
MDQAGYKRCVDRTGFGARGSQQGVIVDDERSTRDANGVEANIANPRVRFPLARACAELRQHQRRTIYSISF